MGEIVPDSSGNLKTMEAVRLHPNPDKTKRYSSSNPAPPSALVLDTDVLIPQPLHTGELLIKVEATTIIRDSLVWPEIYVEENKVLGWDFAGTVISVSDATENSSYQPGDEVFGMSGALKAGTWAQYAIVLEVETCLKPKDMSWTDAAAIPLSALTAYQALFEKAELTPPDFEDPNRSQALRKSRGSAEKGSMLITGAVGGVGLYLVQLAKLTGLHIVAATSSNARNQDFLEKLGADEAVEYDDLHKYARRFSIIIDAVGGDVLKACWPLVEGTGTIISIESESFGFADEHRKAGLASGCENVKAFFFIVEPSTKHLSQLSAAWEAGIMEPFVANVLPLAYAASAYEGTLTTPKGRGKIILTP